MTDYQLATTATDLVDLITALRDTDPDRVVLRSLADGERVACTWTTTDLDRRARAVAVRLRRTGRPGDRALIIHPNGPDYVASFFGTLYAGMVPVPVYQPTGSPVRRTTAGVRAIARDSGARFAFTPDPAAPGNRAAALEELPGFAEWITPESVDETVADTWTRPDVGAGTLAFLQYTSGSTGLPKGVMITHGNLLANAYSLGRAVGAEPGRTTVAWVPLYHDLGLIGCVIAPLAWGHDIVLMTPDDFVERPARWLRAMSDFRAAYTAAPNFAFELCMRRVGDAERAGLDLSAWTAVVNAAEPVRRDTIENFADAYARYGFRRETMRPSWGLAEATLIMSADVYRSSAESTVTVDDLDLTARRVTVATDGDKRSKTLVSNGPAVADHDIVIVDPDRRVPVGPDEVGEVWVGGPCLGQGYWQRPDATAYTYDNRIEGRPGTFLRTGDLGFLRPEGLYVAGRLKDVIIVDGENHYPQDVEHAAENVSPALRPGCGAAFAVDLDDAEYAVLVHEVNPDRVTDADELMAAMRRAVADRNELALDGVFLIAPKSVPKTSSGKIQRSGSREALLDDRLPVLASWRREPFGASLDRARATRSAAGR